MDIILKKPSNLICRLCKKKNPNKPCITKPDAITEIKEAGILSTLLSKLTEK